MRFITWFQFEDIKVPVVGKQNCMCNWVLMKLIR